MNILNTHANAQTYYTKNTRTCNDYSTKVKSIWLRDAFTH